MNPEEALMVRLVKDANCLNLLTLPQARLLCGLSLRGSEMTPAGAIRLRYTMNSAKARRCPVRASGGASSPQLGVRLRVSLHGSSGSLCGGPFGRAMERPL